MVGVKVALSLPYPFAFSWLLQDFLGIMYVLLVIKAFKGEDQVLKFSVFVVKLYVWFKYCIYCVSSLPTL